MGPEPPEECKPTVKGVSPPIVAYGGPQDASWGEAIRAVSDAAANVVATPAFRTHLYELKGIRLRPDSTPVSGEAVYTIYAGLDATTRRGAISLAANRDDDCSVLSCEKQHVWLLFPKKGTNQTGSTAFGGARGSTVLLNQCTLERAASGPALKPDDIEAFACAINTIAHEWGHGIYEIAAPSKQVFQDRGGTDTDDMLASYTLGAVAQCTHLECGHHLPGTFAQCIEAAGTSILKPATCIKGWAKRP